MKISYAWLQDYFEKKLQAPEKVAELLTMHAFEIESIEKVGDDTQLDVKILPDRSHDCLSHIGIAREVALVTGVSLKESVTSPKVLNVPESNLLKVEIEDAKLCKRFSALVIEHIEVGPSPAWLKERLETIGQRSINNVVDATNYVMFALGQPLHAYDRELLTENGGGWEIVVRKSHQGETLVTLDGKDYTFSDELVITDGNADRPLGLAGIKGGKASEITSKTKNVILEAANFEPVNIRKTAKSLGLRTDASVRFENEITPELTTVALKMVADLIVDIAGIKETQVEGLVDVYPRRANPYKLGVSLSDIHNTLGIELSEKDVSSIFDKAGFAWTLVDPREAIIKTLEKVLGVPYKYSTSVSYDAPRSFGCSSLVNYAYLQGGISLPNVSVDQYVFGVPVEESELKPGDIVFSHANSKEEEEFTLMGTGETMRQRVLHTKTFEFMPGTPVPEGVSHNYIYVGDGKVIHASSTKKEVVRVELETIKQTEHVVGFRRIPAIEEKHFVVIIPTERIDLMGRSSFLTSGIKENMVKEIGRIYGYENLVAKPIVPWQGNVEIEKKTYYANLLRKLFVEHGFSEVITYAFRTKGEVELANPVAKDRAFLRANLADGLNESLKLNTHNTDLLGLLEVKIFEIGNVFKDSGEHLMLAFASKNADEMQKLVSSALGVEVEFVKSGDVFEAHIGKVIHDLPEPSEVNASFELSSDRFKPFSEYPFVLRDIAVFVPEGGSESVIIETIQKEAGDLLVSHRLFDTFTKEFPEGNKTSYAYRLVFQSFEKTLSDEEINPLMEKATSILNSKEGFQVR